MAENTLKEFLDKGKDWERLNTTLPGVYVLKLPKYQRSPSRLAVELNPVDGRGNPTKKRGLVLRKRQRDQTRLYTHTIEASWKHGL